MRKIASTSASEAAAGLSTNTGLPRATARNCSRWTRPSTLSNKIASACSATAAAESTIFTPSLFKLGDEAGDPVAAFGNVGTAAGIRDGHLDVGQRTPVACGSLINLVKATTCDVSQPTMPTRRTLS